MIGTTHFTNAVVERARLDRVAAIRIALPASASLQPMVDWPADLRACVDPLMFMVAGGHEYDGRPLVPLDRDAIRDAAMRIRDAGITAIGITALFSPLTAECELEAAEIVSSIVPDARITLSHRLGRIGLLERENVTLLNASLQSLGKKTVDAFRDALESLGILAPFYLTQNDGTVVLAEVAAANPVYSFASGPTNSMRGAAFLSGRDEGMVIDVGGTTSDIGYLVNGFPREANNIVEVGGVRTLFRMPDLCPWPWGRHHHRPRDRDDRPAQRRLPHHRKGSGLRRRYPHNHRHRGRGRARRDRGSRPGKHLDPAFVKKHLAGIHAMIEDGVDRMKTSAGDMPIIVVGGGAFLVPID